MSFKKYDAVYVYCLMPIDWWDGWLTEKEFVTAKFEALFKEENASLRSQQTESLINDLSAYFKFRNQGLYLAEKLGWEGDFREGPYISGIPTSDSGYDGQVLFAWKQDNNGTTFVVSPYELSWLKGTAYNKISAKRT